ncbi:hypothetical protein BDZ88DRAFT_442970, partial [Geranomyces variabilis]
MDHPRVRAALAYERKNLIYKAFVDSKPKAKIKPHPTFHDCASATSASWADVVDGLFPEDGAIHLAATDSKDEINPKGAARTGPLWTLATINGLWAPVILDAGASRSLILGYESVLYDESNLSPTTELNFTGIGGKVTSTTRISLALSLRGKEGEYLSFRGFFHRVKMPDDVILLANDILAPLKIQLTIESKPLPSFATTLSNPDILIPGCISENMDTTHLRGKRVQTLRGPMVQDLPPLNKKRKGATNSTYSAVEAGETDYASYCATSLTLSKATRICDAHKISRDTLAPAPDALEEQFLSESFDVELS